LSATPIGTRTEQVYTALRSDILSGGLVTGSRLRLVELCERFAVSQSVVREALTRLAEQGIVTAQPQHGFRVASLSLEDLETLTDARVHLESLVLRLAVERGDVAWESSLVAAHHQLQRTPQLAGQDQINPDWLAAHEAFHTSLLNGCGNERLLRAAGALRDAAALYRTWSVSIGHDTNRDVASEHGALLEAILRRDADEAAALVVLHIERTSSVLLATCEREQADELRTSTA
jgi:DNA-binding GntR family transcriptional regulator